MARSNVCVAEELNRNLTMVVLPVTVFIGVETFIGFFGNILILLTYTKRYKRSNFRYFVLSMAVIDFTSCVTALPGEIFSQMNWYTYEYGWICKVKSYFNVLTAWGSASILLLLAFDRYRKICKPLAWQIQPSFALKLCACSIVLSGIVAIPVTILWGKQTYIDEHEGHNISVSICEKSGKHTDDIYPLVYISCVYSLPVGITLIVVCSLNTFTARELFGNSLLQLKTAKSETSYAYGSESTLNTFVSETDIEKVGIEMASAKPCSNAHRAKTEPSINKVDDNDGVAEREKYHSKYRCQTKSHAEVHTRVSVIANCRPSVTSTAQIRIPKESRSDFCLDINICSQVVKSGKCEGNTEMAASIPTYRSIKINQNEHSMFHRDTAAVPNKCRQHSSHDLRPKRKTVIMLVLTSVFVVTMLLYVILTNFVAGTDGILRTLTNSQKVVFFFFWRLYFINTIINPLLYGVLDHRFRAGLNDLFRRKGRNRGLNRTYGQRRQRNHKGANNDLG